jgi:hypothetical protein
MVTTDSDMKNVDKHELRRIGKSIRLLQPCMLVSLAYTTAVCWSATLDKNDETWLQFAPAMWGATAASMQP